MRTSWLSLVSIQAVLWSSTLAETTATIPPCSLECLTTIVPQVCGSLANVTCLCTDKSVTAELLPCVATACNITESLRLEAYQAQTCGVKVDRTRVDEQLHIFYVMPALTAMFVALRFLSRWLCDVGIMADDYCMLMAEIAYLVDVSTGLLIATNGFGEHTYSLTIKEVTNALKYFYISELTYVLTLSFTKISLLLFFQRIFPNQRFNIAVWVMVGFIAVSNFSLLMALVFQCVPFHGNWTNWMYKIPPVKCIKSYAAIFTLAGLSIAHDLIIMIMPLPILWELHLPWQKKANLFVMFCIGSFVIVCSLIRLPSLRVLEGSSDPSYDQAPIAVWTNLEQSVGIICGCLPAFRSLIGWTFPALKMNLVGSSKNSGPPSKYGLSYSSRNRTGSSSNPLDREFIELEDQHSQEALSVRSGESRIPLDEVFANNEKNMGHRTSVNTKVDPIDMSIEEDPMPPLPSPGLDRKTSAAGLRIMQTKTVDVIEQRRKNIK